MSKTHLTFAVVVLTLALAIPPMRAAESGGEAAKANLDILVGTIRANRKALIAVYLGLSDREAPKFWPVYDRYAKEIGVVQDRMVSAIEDYIAHFKDLSDER